LTDATGGLVKVFGTASSLIQTLFGNDIVKGATSGLTSTVDYASKGVSSAMGHLFSMDLSAPQFGSFVPETMGIASDVANMAIGFGTMAAAPGVATMLGAGGGPPASAMADSLGGGLNAKGGPGGAGPLSMPGSANGGGAIQTKKFNLDYLHSYRVSTKLGDPAEQGGTHKGTDFVMSEGTDLKAIADGEVTKASGTMQNTWNGGSGPVEMGGEVNIVHQTSDGKQYTSIYGHMSKIYVSKGQQVTKGQVIGKSGNSGYSSGAHLHFEVREGVGRGGRSMPLSEVSSILDNGSRGKDNGGWDDQGANAEGDTPDNTAVYKALAEQAVKDGSNQIKMPSQATAAMATLKGLYSGNTQSILGSVQNMAKNMGVSQANWQSYMNAADVSAHNTATAPAASDALERTRNNNVSNNVSITVQVPDVTSGDAVKFAQLVKQYLDNDSLQSTTGSI
jgi:murein DD-endopeptidase MepM/ murein hydrolase activator NlpD